MPADGKCVYIFDTTLRVQTQGVDFGAWASTPSPVRLTTRPLCTEIVGSIRSLRSGRSRARVRSSSAPASRLRPTTSATRIAASFHYLTCSRMQLTTRLLEHQGVRIALRHAAV